MMDDENLEERRLCVDMKGKDRRDLFIFGADGVLVGWIEAIDWSMGMDV